MTPNQRDYAIAAGLAIMVLIVILFARAGFLGYDRMDDD